MTRRGISQTLGQATRWKIFFAFFYLFFKVEVFFLSKMKYAKINSAVNNNVKKGVLFSTYSALIGESQAGGKYKSRLKQILHW